MYFHAHAPVRAKKPLRNGRGGESSLKHDGLSLEPSDCSRFWQFLEYLYRDMPP
jgi:hypothetical protein